MQNVGWYRNIRVADHNRRYISLGCLFIYFALFILVIFVKYNNDFLIRSSRAKDIRRDELSPEATNHENGKVNEIGKKSSGIISSWLPFSFSGVDTNKNIFSFFSRRTKSDDGSNEGEIGSSSNDMDQRFNKSSVFYTGSMTNIAEKCAKFKQLKNQKVNNLPFIAGQYMQDSWLYFSMFHLFEKYGEKGFYLDLAAAYPMHLSNTFLFDLCFNWKGLCIEGDPKKAEKFRESIRSCDLEEMCITKRKEVRKFISSESISSNSVAKRDQTTSARGDVIETKCGPLGEVLERHNVQNIDFFSLDIEGYEPDALYTIDFTKIKIDIVIVEFASSETVAHQILVKNGFEPMGLLGLAGPNSRIDYVFVRKKSIWYKHCHWKKTEVIGSQNVQEATEVKNTWPYNCLITHDMVKNRFDE